MALIFDTILQGDLVVEFSFIKQRAIYKTRNTGMETILQGMLGTRGMFTVILGNLLEVSGECSHFRIPESTRKDSEVFSSRFRGMFKNFPRDVQRDCRECSRKFSGM